MKNMKSFFRSIMFIASIMIGLLLIISLIYGIITDDLIDLPFTIYF